MDAFTFGGAWHQRVAPKKVGAPEVGAHEVGAPPEVGGLEVGVPQVGVHEVRPDIWILLAPRVPGLNARVSEVGGT